MSKDSGALRQHYKLATGASLQGSAPGPNPGFAKGGRVMKAAVVGAAKTTYNVKGRGPGGKKRNV